MVEDRKGQYGTMWWKGWWLSGKSSRLVILSADLFMLSAFCLRSSSMVLPMDSFSSLRSMIWDCDMGISAFMEIVVLKVKEPV